MDHGLMVGMFWGGMLMMAVPVLFGLGVGAFVLYRYLNGRDARSGASPTRGPHGR
jgi:hypothetical protein